MRRRPSDFLRSLKELGLVETRALFCAGAQALSATLRLHAVSPAYFPEILLPFSNIVEIKEFFCYLQQQDRRDQRIFLLFATAVILL
jgi:hypothetical protein